MTPIPTDTTNRSTTRRPLEALPVTPLNKILILSRASSTPPKLSSTSVELTPPLTPRTPKKSDFLAGSDIFSLEAPEVRRKDNSNAQETDEHSDDVQKQISWEDTVPKPYASKYQFPGSNSSRREEYGRGVWSVVYSAVEIGKTVSSTELLTPPTSPVGALSAGHPTCVVAIKAPIRRDANKVLEQEARVLTYLHQVPAAANYVVGFHGYEALCHTLVLDALPFSLDREIRAAEKHARNNLSTKNMFDPVLGIAQWSELARGLINGLAFLHRRNCVHGDIKPANVLLQHTARAAFRPLYCDFSSSHVLAARTARDSVEEVSAVTTDFTAPELLRSFYRRNGEQRAIATFASDVFAVGVTLLVAATGESPYARARIELQKLGMATEGKPLEFARGGDQASRAMKGKIADRVVSRALGPDASERISAQEWSLEMVEMLAR
ncbi:hypothetical protein MMC06_000993 [Schaereria dolodes]|nr:hypothetical protein [Schaereria dolodes]